MDGPTGEDKRPAARPCQFLISIFLAARLAAWVLGDTVGGRTCRATMTTKERAPMTAGQLAALIAAGFFALLACVACVVLLRLGRLIGAATELMTGYRQRADTLIEQAQAVVDRTNEQLTRTDAITAS